MVWGSLGQLNPAATTLTAVYTVPALKHSAVTVVASNTGGSAATIRISLAVAGAADNIKQYLVYDLSLGVGESYATSKFTVSASDVIRVYSSTANVSFNVNGIEEDA
jgi:hypothetical protein